MSREAIYVRSDGAEVPLVPEPYCEFCCKPIKDDYADLGTCYDCHTAGSRVGGEYTTNADGRTRTTVRFLADLRPFFFRRAGAVGLYVSKLSFLYPEIWILKGGTRDGPKVAALLAECMDHVIDTRFQEFGDASVLVPIPSGSGNSEASILLARELAERRDGMLVVESLRFAEGYVQQRGQNAEARWENPKGKVSVNPRTVSRLAGNTVLLIDDTFVEGGTAHWCSEAILGAGASDVYVLTVGRNVGPKELEYVGYTGRL